MTLQFLHVKESFLTKIQIVMTGIIQMICITYIINEEGTEYYFWNDNINKSQIVKELRAKNFNCFSLQTVFDKTECIKEIIQFSILK